MVFRVFQGVLFVLVLLPQMVLAQHLYVRELIVIPVRQIDATHFEVIEASGAGGSQMWCAAGLFTKRILRQRGGDIAVATALGTSQAFPGRNSVIFSTEIPANSISSYSTTIRVKNKVFSMTHANALCRNAWPERVVRIRLVTG